MTKLEKTIGYEFKNSELLELALTTPAFRMDNPDAKDNQRLEFLGDAVFGILAAEVVFAHFPDDKEGRLTVRRTRLVSGLSLATIAEKIGLRGFLRQNLAAEELPPRAKALADAMEALMGAVWLDGGLDAARAFFVRLGLPVDAVVNEWTQNPKGFLQVKSQALHPPRKPVYTVVSRKGPPHDPVFTVKVEIEGLGEETATANSKSAAEVAAADALATRLFS